MLFSPIFQLEEITDPQNNHEAEAITNTIHFTITKSNQGKGQRDKIKTNVRMSSQENR